MKKVALPLTLAAVVLNVTSCRQPRPIAYRAAPEQLLEAIAQTVPGLRHRLADDPYRVIRRTLESISLATHDPISLKMATFLMGNGVPTADAQINFHIRLVGGMTYVNYDMNNGDVSGAAGEMISFLDRRFVRVQFP